MTKKDLLIIPAILLLGGATFFFTNYTIETTKKQINECRHLQSVSINNGTVTVTTTTRRIYRNSFEIVER